MLENFLDTFLEAALDAVCDGHPSLRDELIQDTCGQRRLKPIQSTLSGLGTEKKGKNSLLPLKLLLDVLFNNSTMTTKCSTT